MDPPLPRMGCPDAAEGDAAGGGAPEPLLLAVALTMPYVPPPIAMAAAPIAMGLVSLWEDMS